MKNTSRPSALARRVSSSSLSGEYINLVDHFKLHFGAQLRAVARQLVVEQGESGEGVVLVELLGAEQVDQEQGPLHVAQEAVPQALAQWAPSMTGMSATTKCSPCPRAARRDWAPGW
jgi:hypothetical protein